MIPSRSSARGSHRSSPKGLIAGALVVAAALTAACQGGPSDVPGGGRGGDADTTLTLVAYAVPEPGFREIIPAFNATEAGKGIQITQSYGASGDQSRGVEGGKPADIVNFSVEPDITRLVKAKKVPRTGIRTHSAVSRLGRW